MFKCSSLSLFTMKVKKHSFKRWLDQQERRMPSIHWTIITVGSLNSTELGLYTLVAIVTVLKVGPVFIFSTWTDHRSVCTESFSLWVKTNKTHTDKQNKTKPWSSSVLAHAEGRRVRPTGLRNLLWTVRTWSLEFTLHYQDLAVCPAH